jgi:putative redox protein
MPRTISVNLTQIGPSTSRATLRSHSLLVDRPNDKGGDDRGPMGGELLLASLGGCFVSTLLAAARTRGAGLFDVHVAVVGTVGGVPERFEAIAMRVSATCDADADLQKLVVLAERGCLVTNTLKDAVRLSVELGEIRRSS